MIYRRLPSLTVLIFLTAGYVSLSSADIQSESERVIRGHFAGGRVGTALQLTEQEGVTTLEICFDQCDIYRWRGSPDKPAAWDFILAYEYKRGAISEDEQFLAAARKAATAAAKRMVPHCELNPEQAEFDCTWVKLASSRGIRVGASTYDEGQRCFAWVNLSTGSTPDKWSCGPIRRSPWKNRS
jgi:hypothetical protein